MKKDPFSEWEDAVIVMVSGGTLIFVVLTELQVWCSSLECSRSPVLNTEDLDFSIIDIGLQTALLPFLVLLT